MTNSEMAEILLTDLENYRLEIALIPAPEPKYLNHMIRVAINSNPTWYQELYASRGKVDRQRVIRTLKRIMESGELEGSFISDLVQEMKTQNYTGM